MTINDLWMALSRKKTYTEASMGQTELARKMSLLDLTLLGVGTSLGLGAYVLAGSVAKNLAGPSTIVSFVIAGMASVFAALCYAEFAGRVPRSGSAYVYSYVCVGEGTAFVIGWSMILEYMIGGATLARGLVGYLDSQTGSHMDTWLKEAMPMNAPYLAPYPDFLALFLVLLLSGLLAFGVRESTIVNNILTALNVCTLLTVIVAGTFNVNPRNWNIPKSEIPKDAGGGEGGFFPFGLSGVTAGAAECFFGFVGFDTIAAAGEEAKNPQRDIPLAICISVSIVILVYVGISTVLTMMWPYYLQNVDSPLPYVFEMVGWNVVRWIVTVGAVFSLMNSMLAGMYPPPRIIYAMANDGLLFKFLAKVHLTRQTPMVAIMAAGAIAGITTVIFELHHLVEMLSIGTLLAYIIVALCVLRLRYEDPVMWDDDTKINQRDPEPKGKCLRVFDYFLNINGKTKPTEKTSFLAKVIIWIFCMLNVILNTIITLCESSKWTISAISVIGFIIVFTLIVLARQPNTTIDLVFKVPLVPVLPAVSIVINTYLMLQLQRATWVRLGAWMLIGFVIYFAYGLKNSVEGERTRQMNEGGK